MHAKPMQPGWLTISEAIHRMPVPVSRSTLRRWIEEGKHGIVAGRFGARLVVREDSLPNVVDDPEQQESHSGTATRKYW